MSIIFKRLLFILLVTSLFPAFARGQADPFQVTATVSPERINAGSSSRISVGLIASPNHYIYKDQVRVDVEPLEGFQVEPFNFPASKVKYDTFLEKEVEVYEGKAELSSTLNVLEKTSPGKYNVKLTVHYQGCSATTCFLPTSKSFVLPIEVEPSKGGLVTKELTEAAAVPVSPSEKEVTTEKGTFQQTVEKKGIFAALLLAFLAGIGLSFTPCVYPMIPITVAVIGGQSAGTPLKGFLLSLVYVLGISIVYSVLGIIAASTGALFGSAMQSPYVIGFVVAVFIVLAFSMFGAYTLQTPTFLSEKFGPKSGAGIAGVFFMGLVSGTVASPCVGPALVSLLVYIASTGSKALGFWMLFTFAWGLGLLLIVIGTFSGSIKALPRSGAWMGIVERFFGLMLFGAALYYLRLIIPEWLFTVILGIFLIVTGVFSGGLDRIAESGALIRVKKSFGIVCLVFGLYFLAGSLLIKGLFLPPLSMTSQTISTQEKIDWVTSEEKGLAEAKASAKPAMIDFWAEWCSVCKQMDKNTYSDPEVIKESKRFINIKVDCTDSNDPPVRQLL
ncbi:MAG: protein-disulfide reductase DsbD, partial [Planctomycetes bacterium]|nr:protein-disulfide reductase DsbD [Planctomycetota bacterium]